MVSQIHLESGHFVTDLDDHGGQRYIIMIPSCALQLSCCSIVAGNQYCCLVSCTSSVFVVYGMHLPIIVWDDDHREVLAYALQKPSHDCSMCNQTVTGLVVHPARTVL